jgi:hypothetical protein
MLDNPKQLPPASDELAFKRWMELGKPSFRDLSAALVEDGFWAHFSTISRMKDRNPLWITEFENGPSDSNANRLHVALKLLKSHSKEVDADVYLGLGARLVGKAVSIIDKMSASTPDELHRILDAIDRVKGFAHAAKGDAITEVVKGNGLSGTNGSGNGVLSMLTPKVAVAPFNGANGANGHAKKVV